MRCASTHSHSLFVLYLCTNLVSVTPHPQQIPATPTKKKKAEEKKQSACVKSNLLILGENIDLNTSEVCQTLVA